MKRFMLKATIAAMGLGIALGANAESNIVTGAATSSPGAKANVDFTIIIPKILFLRVGTGSAYWPANSTLTNNTAVDLITFTVSPGGIGAGAAGVTPTGGDLSAAAVTAAVVSNSGNVTLVATALGAMNNGVATETISFADISTTAATLNSTTALPAPTLTNTTSTSIVLTAPATKVIKQDAKWTYAYANTAYPPAGTYGGVNTNNGRITYTATMP